MDYNYGDNADQVDEFFRAKRSWSRVKDEILEKYLVAFLRVVPGLQKPILLVDGFSGPGMFGDDSDGSPRIICRVAQANRRDVAIRCLFADVRPAHRVALQRALAREISAELASPPFNDCEEALAHALSVPSAETMFFYLDPYGIKDLEFDTVRKIYERMNRKSTEVLMNFSFRAFMRLSGNWNYSDSGSEVATKVKQEKIETVNRVMGGEYWKDIVFDPNLSSIEREEALIAAYLKRIREVCRFAYSVPVKEPREDQPGAPEDELAHYHLIFATRSPKAVVLMNDIGLGALEPYFNQFKEGAAGSSKQMRLLDITPDRYRRISEDAAKESMIKAAAPKPVTREEIFEEVIPQHFMQHKKKIYRAWIDDLHEAGKLFPDPSVTLHRHRLNDRVRLWAKPWS